MINIDSNLNTQLIEESYLRFSSESNIDLFFSQKANVAEFGIIPAVIQMVVSWHNIVKEGKIVVGVSTNEEIEALYNIDYFFSCIVYCWSREIVDISGNNIKPILKVHNEKQSVLMKN